MRSRFFGAALAMMAAPSVAWADYGAIAFSQGEGAHGYAFRRSTRQEAEAAALRGCERYADDCAIVLYFHNACGALAVGENRGYGVAWNTDKAAAQTRARRACQQHDDGCRVIRWQCSG